MTVREAPLLADSADVVRRLDELQAEVTDLRARIERMRDEPDLRRPERHRTRAPYRQPRDGSGK